MIRGNDQDQRPRHADSRRAARLYALILRLYPRTFRQAFGEQMLQTFRDHYRDTVAQEGQSEARFWLGVIRDAGASLANEHRAVLGARRWPMKKILLGLLVVGLALTVLVVANLPARAPAQNPALPINDPIWRPVLEMTMLGLTLGLYVALVAAIVQVVRAVVRSPIRLGWVRLGLELGGILSLYAVVVNVVAAVVPDAGSTPNGFLVLTLPLLLTGVIGVIGGYASGTMHAGALAGLLAGLVYVLIIQLSWVLVLVVAWPAIQHGLLSSGVESDFQRLVQATGRVPDLGTFLNFELFEDGISFPLMASLIGLTLEGLCAAMGGAIGASLRQADERSDVLLSSALPARRPALPSAWPVGFLLEALALDLLVWTATVEFNALGGAHRVFGLGDLANSFISQTFGLWLLGLLVVLAFVLVSARFAPNQPDVALASG